MLWLLLVAPGAIAGEPGKISGTITVPGHKPVWVFVDGPGPQPEWPDVVQMWQRGMEFEPPNLVVVDGTTVEFPNGGPEQHNVYSVAAHDSFNLGIYPVGQRSEHRFVSQAGRAVVYELRCHRHATMRAWILAVPNRWVARVGPDGTYEIPDVTPGVHRVVAWSEAGRGETTVTVEPGSAATFSWSLQTGTRN